MTSQDDEQHADDRVAEAFLDHFDLRPRARDRQTLEAIGAAFARLPYENLSKVLRKHDEQTEQTGGASARRRLPQRVFDEHLALGAGGTCFALTRLFSAVLTRLGYRSRVALCDTSRGEARLERVADDRYELYTYGRRRYELKLAKVDMARFEAVWDASFDWTMMNGVHVCAADEDGGYAYLHGHKLRLQGVADKRTLNLRGREVDELATRFGLAPALIERAYQLVERARDD